MERQELLLSLIRKDLCSRARGCPDVSLAELLEGKPGFEPLVNALGSFGHVSLVDIFDTCLEADDEYHEACGYKSDLDDEVAGLEVEKSDLEREIKGLVEEKDGLELDVAELSSKFDKLETIKEAFDELVTAAMEIKGGVPLPAQDQIRPAPTPRPLLPGDKPNV